MPSDESIPSLPLVKLSGARTDCYEFLASAHDTKFALTPIHTNEEYALFTRALRTDGPFAVANGTPNFRQMAKWWSSQVNGKKIFYKLPEQLKSHYKTWSALRAEMTTLQLTEKDREQFMELIRSDAHTSVVLDESYSPVIQGRTAAASSAKIAVRNRQNVAAASKAQNRPNAVASSSKAFVPPSPQPDHPSTPGIFISQHQQPPVTLQFVPAVLDAAQEIVPKQPRGSRTCVTCRRLGKDGKECPGRGGKKYCPWYGT